MQKSGRKTVIPSSILKQAVETYLNSDKTLVEVAAEYGLKTGTLQYHVQKYRKETNDK